MDFTGIESVTYGVENLQDGIRFFTDWGLKKVANGKAGAVFETLDGGRIVLKPGGDGALPRAVEPGSTVRELVWGVKTRRDLDGLAKRLAPHVDVQADRDGTLHIVDPAGIGVGFTFTQRRKVALPPPRMNAPHAHARIDQTGPRYQRAQPIKIGHAVFVVPSVKEMERFYTKAVGFHVSDRYEKDQAIFLRCSAKGDHHNFFLMQSPSGKTALNHIAFACRDIHEVFGGGLAFAKRGYKTAVGPGRHPISSAYFWYFENPCGGAVEYFADEDHLTPAWKPKRYKRVPENFAEWALHDGIQRSDTDVKERAR